MDRRFRIFGAGLLTAARKFPVIPALKKRVPIAAALFFLAAVSGVWAEAGGADEGDAGAADFFADAVMDVAAVYSPQNPLVRGNLVVTILADHPLPAEVTVHPPRIPSALILERVRYEARQIQRPGMFEEQDAPPELSRWTAVEFLFTSLAAGIVEIEPIEVRAPGKMARTSPIQIRIYEDTRSARRYTPVLRWENPPASLETGEEAEIVLALSGWDPALSPPEKIFGGRAPRGAVLEELPLDGPGGDGIIRYRCRLIPLPAGPADGGAEESSLVLDAFSLPVEGHLLELPRLVLKISGARPSRGPAEVSAAGVEASGITENPALEAKPETEPPPFPGSRADDKVDGTVDGTAADEKIFPLFRKEHKRVRDELEKLWETGGYARVLAELRRNERENFAGPSFVPLRRELEKNLRLSATEDESWQFWKIPLALIFAVFVFILIFRRIRVTSGRLRGYKVIIPLAAGVTAVAVLLAAGRGAGAIKSGAAGRAVLEAAAAYRVPDVRGTVNARFEEGQPVRIISGSGEWFYVESADGRAGWIRAEAAIPYSR